MNCEQAREKLSTYLDRELSDEELQQVSSHLSACPSCRQELDHQGAMDMLLKNCYSPEPPAGILDGLWPTISEQLDEPSSGGAGTSGSAARRSDEEIVFKSSAAMQILNIPEPARPLKRETTTTSAAAAEVTPPASPWRWPVTLIVSSVILVVGMMVYKKMEPAPAPVEQAAIPTRDEVTTSAIEEPAAGPAVDASMQVAMAASGEAGGASPGAPGEAKPDEPEEAEPARGRAARPERRREASHRPARAGKKEKAVRPAAPAVAARAEPAPLARAASKKGDTLDSLIDNVIGDRNVPKTKKAAPAPAPLPAATAGLTEQLNMAQIRGAMNRISGLVQSCYDKYQQEGRANVSLVINNDGSVSDVKVRGKFFGTDTGTCVTDAVKKATFPKFSGKPMGIKYPFILQ